ncbi:hypothetical protein [Shewanella colwelliana]|uniref:hypothetical protein n=1 Tax=Shewanella colwelliana TaxID=23 RepID=UPI0022AF5AD1|nr:hypothetical protein [Shewanella colwelliana]MCZ4337695.1 hypothetical protein [Shewanella colwelliana]
MKFRFENGKIIKTESHYYSRTHVSGGPGFLTNQTEISSSSTDACKVDVWIQGVDRQFCITLEQPFKALPDHDVTISYSESGAPIQLINNSTGQAIWFSYKGRRAFGPSSGSTIFETEAAFVVGKTLKESLFLFTPLLIALYFKSPWLLLCFVGALIYFGRKATPNFKGGGKQSCFFYGLILFIMPLFGRDIHIAYYVVSSIGILFVAKWSEKSKFEPKEHGSIGYEAAKAQHYQPTEAKEAPGA